ncbi:PDZ domain-containing protein [Granulicella sp. 5B5]|uniref:trypsin-like peptidase domain-containing protein n=1 Tax=Granulicella sp. 5B5 TaxID=1617967 RepID=UPI0015F4988F|nr:trypsin-like peptidase domain-containing protein [Granulicella sp. 5B5]QMV17367.1 PDZ domain-containing protein [Granulicella sp. 5B5]
MESITKSGRTLWNRVRSGHMPTTFGLLAVLTLGIVVGSTFTGSVSAHQQKVDTSDARPLTIPNPVTLSNGFSSIVKQVSPAVVNISTEELPKQSSSRRRGRGQVMPNPNGGDGSGGDDQDNGGDNSMQDFFNHFFGGQPGQGDDGGDGGVRRALGSGYIVDPRGYIITNNHVVDKADKIYVKLASDPQDDTPGDPGRPATVVGVDKDTDIAVIKIDPKGLTLPTVKLGNSDGAQVGDWVLAIGSPFGLSQTVSAGIVSAKDRTIDEGPGPGNVATNQFQRFIQTDASINPGNSGGPLVDMAGEVIGMNTAIYTQSAGSEGIGFAMPSNTIINVYNMLIGPEHKVIRGSIGIQFQAATSSAVAREYGFSSGGIMISIVTPGGPAAKAGLQPQDVIVAIDGTPVKNGDALVNIISARKPGSTVRLTYLRGGKRDTVNVSIADRAKLFANIDNGSDQSATPDQTDIGETTLGITVQAISPQQATKLNIKGGVAVTSVKPGSFADNIGLGPRAIITEINRKPITDLASYQSIVSGLKSGDDVVFVIRSLQDPSAGSSYVGGTLP